VTAFDAKTLESLGTIPVGQRPGTMALTPDGSKLYVANGRSNSVSVIDTKELKQVGDVPVGEAPGGVVIR